MQLRAMFRKEIQILFSNRLLIFANILMPILVICVNLIYTRSAVIDLKIGYYGEPAIDSRIEETINQYSDDIIVQFIPYENEESAKNAYDEKEICMFIHFMDASHMEVYYDSENQKENVAYQYLIKALQDINSSQYTKEMLNAIISAQTFVVTQTISLTKEASDNINPYIWTGFIWIFVYSNLSLAITQMQQERNTKTILYLCKVGVSNFQLFLSKALVAVIQFVIIIFVFSIVTTKLELFEYQFWMPQIIYYLLVCICIVSIGHLLGTLIKNSSLLVIIQMLIILPLMLINALQTSMFDLFLKRNPIYCGISIAKSASMGQSPFMVDVIICSCTIVVCYMITCIYLKKREPIKLCKLQ